jgi:hypothetical protein
MISKARMEYMASRDRWDLAMLLAHSGCNGAAFESSVFAGIIRATCEFRYDVTFFDESGTGPGCAGHVYLRANDKDEVEARY